jgi:hypothetical protein
MWGTPVTMRITKARIYVERRISSDQAAEMRNAETNHCTIGFGSDSGTSDMGWRVNFVQSLGDYRLMRTSRLPVSSFNIEN